jgi:hypothetical protein
MLGINPQYLTALYKLSEIPPHPSSILSHHALWMDPKFLRCPNATATAKGNRDSQRQQHADNEFALHDVNRIRSVLCNDRSMHHSPH